jgi:hypothetical protein
MDIIYIDDITGTIGQWLDEGFDEEVPVEVIRLLQEVYRLSAKELEK